MAWFRGDLHTHSAISRGGELTPAQVVAEARAAGLDFVAATEHGTSANRDEWAAEDFLVIGGQENVTPDGHWLSVGGLRVIAHPYAPYPGGTFTMPRDGFDLYEVWNGAWRSDVPWQADNEAALAGWDPLAHPAVGNSDIHLAGQLGEAHNVVRADDLTADAILTALRRGRSWIAGDPGIEMTFEARVGGQVAQIGDTVLGEPELTIDVRNVPGHVITVVERPTYVRLEVRHPDGRMAALTNHINVIRG